MIPCNLAGRACEVTGCRPIKRQSPTASYVSELPTKQREFVFLTKKGKVYTLSPKGKKKCIVKKKGKKLILKNKFAVKVQAGKKYINIVNK